MVLDGHIVLHWPVSAVLRQLIQHVPVRSLHTSMTIQHLVLHLIHEGLQAYGLGALTLAVENLDERL